ncbi:MAG: FAD-dependent oxidoreductase, partial [Kiritimatiellae bacterium]|nr:FAD-dependent oxidoreductase [Kiritimatiellia bacterium]
HDLTGYYGRCDAIVFASDTNWTPPVGRENIAVLREKYGGVSRKIEKKGPYDVVVIGGGLAGCTAAVAASRNGAKVVLIQDRPLLGGNASTEILVPPVGVWPSVANRDPLDPRETGLVEEYRTAGNQKVKEGVFYSDRLMRFVKLEPNLDLYLNTHATGVKMVSDSKKRIATVLAVNVKTGQRMRFAGKMFIDCTGDSVVGVAAGAEYRCGKEPQSMYQEPWAPPTASKETMGNGLKYYHQDTGKLQPFAAPAWVFKFLRCEDFSTGRHPRFINDVEVIGHQWMIELGGFRDTYTDAEEIRDDLIRLIFGMWDHSKNHCSKDKDLVTNHKLAWVGHVAGKRENRRLIGDYVLTQNDIGNRTLFPDRVIYGGWSVDDHYSAGFFHRGSTGQYTKDWERAYVGRTFSIPFRSLYSRNIDNLLMAGRNISASHLAMSDTRVMLTCAVMGQAVGTGAALCIERRTTPRGIYEKHLEELQQQLLKDGNYIINLPNRDPRDLARQAQIVASSEGTYTNQKMAAVNVINGYARAENGKPNAWMPDKNTKGPHWVELSWSQPQKFNMVHVIFQTVKLAPKHFAVETWQDNAWKQIAEVKENQHRRHVLGLDRQVTPRLRVVLDEPKGICEIRIYNESQRLVDIARRAENNMQLPDTSPQLPWEQH